METNSANPVLSDYPNARSNVFLMTRFRDTAQQQEIGQTIRVLLEEYGLKLIRADAKSSHQELWSNVRLCIDASVYGIAVFEQIDERDINPNVSLELGYMLGEGKRCLLLKEQRVPSLPSDLLGHVYRPFDSYDIGASITEALRGWLQDLGIAKRPNERLLLYVSHGGTCRCAMAKAITRSLIRARADAADVRVESVAYGEPSQPVAAGAARNEIVEVLGDDALADHRTMRLTPTLKQEADLILVMERSLLKGLPPGKSHVLKPFLGLSGDISDPWPDTDAEAPRRYAACALELREALEPNIGRILEGLRPAHPT
jgi:protein-tyrosine-phosphatase